MSAAESLVLCASDLLARDLRSEHSLAQRQAGRAVWEAPEIHSLWRWLHDSWTASWPTAQLLHPVQELVLWRDAVSADRAAEQLLSPLAAAREARMADQLAVRYGVPDDAPIYSEEQRAFRRWRSRVRREYLKHDWLTAADLADEVTALVEAGAMRAPRRIELRGFLEQPPASLQRLLDALAARGSEISHYPSQAASRPQCFTFADAEAQYRYIAASISELLKPHRDNDQPPPRILVACADPEAQRDLIEATFRPLLAPWRNLPAGGSRVAPWRWEAGLRLDVYPLISAALAVLALQREGNTPEQLSRVLLSSVLWGPRQRDAAAALDYRMRKLGRPLLRLAQALELAPEPLRLPLQQLRACIAAAPKRALPSAWAAHWDKQLAAIGWPGQELSSTAFQTRGEWDRVLSQFASLDRQLGQTSQGQAGSWLRELLGAHRYEPRAEHEQPAHIVSYDAAAGIHCDYLFVTDATADRWLTTHPPTPYLAREALVAAGVPGATTQSRLENAQRLSSHLLQLAPAVTICAPLEDERASELLPSPLFGLPHVWQPAPDVPPDVAQRCASAGRQTRLPAEDLVPAVADPKTEGVRGGVAIFRDFVEAPFFSFCRHRLGIEAFPERAHGLTTKVQGIVVHCALEGIWGELRNRDGLQQALDASTLGAVVANSLDAILRREMPDSDFGPGLLRLERSRLESLLARWLTHEAKRVDWFEVRLREHQITIEVAGLSVALRIDRVDEIRTPLGPRYLVLDYKTGREASTGGWKAQQLREPQLPLYASSNVLAGAGIPAVDGICFARVRDGQHALVAETNWRKKLAENGAVFNDPSWPQRLAEWRVALMDIARRFLAGEAGLDPTASYFRNVHADLLALANDLEAME